MKLALAAPAKLNLDLAVVGRREDGMHEVRTRLQAISLHDLLLAEPDSETRLEGGLEGDLVLRSAAALEAHVGRRLPTRLVLWKRIPAGAGMGGGSSDAAATLRLMSAVHGLDIDLLPVARPLGADVPFFLEGGARLAQGVGDELVPLKTADAWYALAWPGIELSTRRVYETWDRVGGDGRNQLERAAHALSPELSRFAAALTPGWRMTGSGSAYFKECASRAEAEAEAAQVKAPWTSVASALRAWRG